MACRAARLCPLPVSCACRSTDLSRSRTSRGAWPMLRATVPVPGEANASRGERANGGCSAEIAKIECFYKIPSHAFGHNVSRVFALHALSTCCIRSEQLPRRQSAEKDERYRMCDSRVALRVHSLSLSLRHFKALGHGSSRVVFRKFLSDSVSFVSTTNSINGAHMCYTHA